ncbi:transient receptor potential channel pyrexia [Halyomorpha halys]|uniref:transient receptor potential channel pyrexia n=1 Tax=Halyomorpha halys TaxID=286706 RepID=UPI0006D4D581|nr:transient receptor potential channel pyrexia-like [Halyomorpha halys]
MSTAAGESQEIEKAEIIKKRRLNTQLLLAVCNKDHEKVESLLKEGANPNTRCQASMMSVCHLAVYYGDNDILELLLRSEADPRARDMEGLQPHHLAAYKYTFVSSVQCLETIFKKDSTLINSAVEKTDLKVPEDQLDSFVHDHDEVSRLVPENVTEGSTLLFLAAKFGYNAIVELLLKHKADVNIATKDNLTALDVTGLEEIKVSGCSVVTSQPIDRGASDTIVEKLLKNNSKPSRNALYNAVETGRIKLLTEYLKLISPDVIEEEKPALIFLAIKNNERNDKNKMRYHEVLGKLLENDTSTINTQDDEGRTPLFLAVEERRKEDIELLLQNNADITIPSYDNRTVFHLVAEQGNCELLNVFIGSLSREVVDDMINKTDNEGYTPLFRAVEGNHHSSVEVLLKFPFRIRYLSTHGTLKGTLLHSAVNGQANNDITILKKIIVFVVSNNSYNLDYLNERNSQGLSALELAASHGYRNCVEFLLSYCKQIKDHFLQSIVSEKDTLLHLAAKGGHYRTIEYLLDTYPILITIDDSEKRSALVLAALGGHEKCVSMLLKRGASLADCDSTLNRTAIDIIMNYIPSPVQMIEHLLDSFTGIRKHKKDEVNFASASTVTIDHLDLEDNDCDKVLLDKNKIAGRNQPDDVNFEVLLDYSMLVAGQREMEVIEAVSESKFDQLKYQFFLHPLVRSFLTHKWMQVDFTFTVLSFIYITHICSVTGLALSFRNHLFSLAAWIFRIGIWTTIVPVICMEIICWMLKGKIYSEAEIYTKWFSIATTGALSVAPELWWGPYLASITVLLAWVELLLFYATSPTWGLYILMFFEVVKNVLQVISSFIFLLVGFALSFFILFNGRHPFSDIWNSLSEVLAMMLELGYNDMFDGDNTEIEPLKVFGRIMYLGFMLLVIMVLTNIILGMSVGDVTQLEGKSKHLAKQGSFLSLMDKFWYNDRLRSLLPNVLLKQIKKSFHPKLKGFTIHPNRPSPELKDELVYEIMTIISGKRHKSIDLHSLSKALQLVNRRIDHVSQEVEAIHNILKSES